VTEQQFSQGDLLWKTGGVIASTSANPAQAGQVRLGNGDEIRWRNLANTFDQRLLLAAAQGNIPQDIFLFATSNGGNLQPIWTSFIVPSIFNSVAVGGNVRLGTNDQINWRNGAGTQDVFLRLLGAAGNIPADTFQAENTLGNIVGFWGNPIIASATVNAATSGNLRMESNGFACFRNNANNNDICISKNTSDQLQYNGVPVAISYTQTSAATNFGTTLAAQTIVPSVTVSGPLLVTAEALVTLVGAGCSVASNTVTVNLSWTAPGGTVEGSSWSATSISGNGSLDTGETTGQGPVVTAIRAKAGTAITYTTTTTLGSTGCSPIPQYTVFAKAIY
jgi:hypothetical protein